MVKTQWWRAETSRLLLWAPVCFAAGILVFFAWPSDPPLMAAASAGGLPFLLRFVYRKWQKFFLPVLAVALVVAGFSYAIIHSSQQQMTRLNKPLDFTVMQGRIAQLEVVEGGLRLTMDQLTIKGMDEAPETIRIKLRGQHPQLMSGQRISLRGGLMPASGPAGPGGFDFARWFYFKGIGAVGYGIPPVDILRDEGEVSALTQWREGLSKRIRDQLPEAEGAVAAALMTGDRAAIPEDVQEVMRATSLSHILAISGMHMAIITGLIYVALRFLLAALPLTRYQLHNKKSAAMVALLAGLAYLLIAGMPVSALRAWVMVALLFTAVLCDRRVMPMRSLMLAAMLLLLWHPAYVLEPGFQLSFTATAALIAWYERLSGWDESLADHQRSRIALWLGGILMTSAVAQLATTPLVLYHFSYIPVYGLPANLLVMPLVSFAMMPLVVIAYVLMPLGLEWLALTPLGWTIRAMITIAQWITQLPYDQIRLPSLPAWGMLFCAFGLCWLLLWRTRLRLAGVVMIAAGLASYAFIRLPDVYISQDVKQVALRQKDGSYAMLRGSPRGFIVRQWAEGAGAEQFARKAEMACDPEGCAAPFGDGFVALPEYSMALAEDCRFASLVITPSYVDQPCAAEVIDRNRLKREGHVWGWYDEASGGWRFTSTRAVQGDRIWSR